MSYGDYSAGHLTGTALRNAGITGVVRYFGTPGRTKNGTAAETASLKSAGVDVHGVYENGTSDFAGGYAAGVANARALLNDATACGVPGTAALFVSADQHLASAQLVQWKAYLQGAMSVLGARCGAYGFSEAIAVAKSLGIRHLWQCGSRSALVAGVNLYQRNSGQTTITVSGVSVDVNDVITPFTSGGDDLAWTDSVIDPSTGKPALDVNGNPYSYNDAVFYIDKFAALIANIPADVWNYVLTSIDGKGTELPAGTWHTGNNFGAWSAADSAAEAVTTAQAAVDAINAKSVTVSAADLQTAVSAALAATPVQAGATPDEIAAAVITAIKSNAPTVNIVYP